MSVLDNGAVFLAVSLVVVCLACGVAYGLGTDIGRALLRLHERREVRRVMRAADGPRWGTTSHHRSR